MKTEKIGKVTIEIYDSIDELPIRRYHKFNKFMLVDSGIGSDLNDIDGHIQKLKKLIVKEDKANALVQADNLRESLFMVMQEVNIRHLSFMVLVKTVNGKPNDDLSLEGLQKTLEYFQDQTKSKFEKLIDSIKKKLETELNLYFPGNFDDATVKEYFDKIKERLLLNLDEIIRGNDNTSKLDQIDDFLLTLAKPKIFSGKESAEIKFEKQFEEMCLFLKNELSVEPDNMTVLQFYNSFEYLKKLRKKNGRQSDKI